jgi:hypothetical protein
VVGLNEHEKLLTQYVGQVHLGGGGGNGSETVGHP